MFQTITIYLLKAVVISGLLLSYYSLALRNKRFHYYNRFYLLATVVLSILLPLISTPFFTLSSNNDTAINLLNVMYADGEKDAAGATNSFAINWQLLVEIVCLCASVLLLFVQFFRIIQLYKIKRNYPVHAMQNFDFVQTDLQQAPFSFLKNIFWRNDISLEETSGRLILQHEITHVQQKHTWDKLFIQLVRAIFWMNPFYYFIQKELFLIHEFIADDKAVADKDAAAFAEMLLQSQYGNFSFSPANHFSYSPIKRRLFMLTTSKKPSFSYVRRIMALPLLACTVLLFAFRLQKENSTNANAVTNATRPFTIIVDAGHGGTDAGAVGINGIKEKDITLALAQKLKDLSANYGINVILTRNSDVTMTPQSRTDFTLANKADAFVSVHVNTTDPTDPKINSGMEVLVSKDNTHFGESKLLGSAVVQKLSTDFSVNQNLIEPKTGVWVLKSNSLPSVLVEFGYIDNKSDAALLESDTKLDAMARNVLEAVAVYANNKTAEINSNALPTQDSYAIVDTATPKTTPLYILDGKEVDASIMKVIDVNKIESINVLKDESAKEKYGDKGKYGVIEITSKKQITLSDPVKEITVTGKNIEPNITRDTIKNVVVVGKPIVLNPPGNDSIKEVIVVGEPIRITIKDTLANVEKPVRKEPKQ